MIKTLRNQKEIEIRCPFFDKNVLCSQSYYDKLPNKPVYGKKLCLESDNCKRSECKYHNANIGEI